MWSISPYVTMSPAILLTYLYFLQGLPYGLQAKFLPIYFRAHGMSLSNIGFIKVLFFPWMCKTLWAPFVDRHGNKKTWLSWSMPGLALTCLLAAAIQPDWLFLLSIILLTFNFLTSTQDIATDGLAIEILTSSQVASGNIAQVVGYKLGAIIGGGLLAWLSEHISWSAIFSFLTLIYVMAMFMVKWFVPESKNYFVERTVDVPAPSDTDFLVSRRNYPGLDKENPGSDDNEPKQDSPLMNTRSKLKHANSAFDSSTDLNSSLKRDTDGSSLKHEATDKHGESRGCDFKSSPHSTSSSTPGDDDSARGGICWVKNHFADVLKADGTLWILAYVLVYKLGEQGALNMMPMLLIDRGVGTAEVGLWTGVAGQAVSITGSVLGGTAITSGRYTALRFLLLLSVVKVVVLALETLVVSAASVHTGALGVSTVACIVVMQLLLFVSGGVSTVAFTVMMQCSQAASPHCRASHYSLLATAEVMGKLTFSIFVGAITDMLGYPLAFGLFFTLSILVLPLFWYAPKSLALQAGVTSLSTREERECDKKC